MRRDPTECLESLEDLLAASNALGASDLILTVGRPPTSWVEGKTTALSPYSLTANSIERITQPLLNDQRRSALYQSLDLDFAYFVPSVGRFRLNIFRQRGNLTVVARGVSQNIPNIDTLGLPVILKDLACLQNGLIFVTGAAGTGKSTTLAAMIDHRNSALDGHIVTLEDPIEFVHEHKKSVISQREIGRDIISYSKALRSVLRQAPSAILVGEIRDEETAEAALHVAETGHLVLTSIHAVNAVQTLNRFLDLFDSKRRPQILALLSFLLAAVISQRLVPEIGTNRRLAAFEILTPTPRLKELISIGDENGLHELMTRYQGSENIQTFEDSLFELIQKGRVSLQGAIPYADSPASLKLRIQLDKTFNTDKPKMSTLFKLG